MLIMVIKWRAFDQAIRYIVQYFCGNFAASGTRAMRFLTSGEKWRVNGEKQGDKSCADA